MQNHLYILQITLILLEYIRCNPCLSSTTILVTTTVDKDVSLPCYTPETHSVTCQWIKATLDGTSEIIIKTGIFPPPPRFSVKNPSTGDCTLHISKVKIEDAAYYSCKIPDEIKLDYKLEVEIEPLKPVLFYNGTEVPDGSRQQVSMLDHEQVHLQWLIQNAIPTMNVSWKIEPFHINHISEKISMSNDKINISAIVRFRIDSTVYQPQVKISCTVEQDGGKPATTSVIVGFQYATREVKALRLGTIDKWVLYCDADGIPEPEYQWRMEMTSENYTQSWELVSEEMSMEPTENGRYKCLARNTDVWLESDVLYIRMDLYEPKLNLSFE